MFRVVAAIVAAGVAAAAPASAATAAAWAVEAEGRSLTWSVRFENRRMEGEFGDFSAVIAFDPADLAGSHVTVTVEIDSVVAETPAITTEVQNPTWFDVEAYPTAIFAADTFRALGDDAYEADGTLTIRDIAQPVTLPFTFAIDGDRAEIAGGVTIDRLDFGVGQGDWAIDDVVGFEIAIDFSLSTSRAD